MEPNLTNEKEEILAIICLHLLFCLHNTNPMQEYMVQLLVLNCMICFTEASELATASEYKDFLGDIC